MSKPKLLITIGDSWTYGVGNLHSELFEECLKTKNYHEFHTNPIQLKYELENSWGSFLSDKMGFDYFLNFSYPATSFRTLWKLFLRLYPTNTFSEYEVYIILMPTYSNRISLDTLEKHVVVDKDDELYHEYVKFSIKNDFDINSMFYNQHGYDIIESIDFITKAGWKFLLGFVSKDDERYFIKKYKINDYSNVIIPSCFSHGMFQGTDVNENWKVRYDGHINSDGYMYVANHIYKFIKNTNINWPLNTTNTIKIGNEGGVILSNIRNTIKFNYKPLDKYDEYNSIQKILNINNNLI